MDAHCECGICGHFNEKDCIEKECKCCSNFHLRSGSKTSEKNDKKLIEKLQTILIKL